MTGAQLCEKIYQSAHTWQWLCFFLKTFVNKTSGLCFVDFKEAWKIQATICFSSSVQIIHCVFIQHRRCWPIIQWSLSQSVFVSTLPSKQTRNLREEKQQRSKQRKISIQDLSNLLILKEMKAAPGERHKTSSSVHCSSSASVAEQSIPLPEFPLPFNQLSNSSTRQWDHLPRNDSYMDETMRSYPKRSKWTFDSSAQNARNTSEHQVILQLRMFTQQHVPWFLMQ